MNEEPFVPIETLAKHFAVSVPTIRSWYRTNKIPSGSYVKVGNTYRFRISTVEDALKNTAEEPVNLEAEQHEHDLLFSGDNDVDDDV
jgi:excisionase family DNA binding protein|tara:strand:+ start:1321 stop:1581 length:261 start_codon:yes stop_codon:yes gene_type:complete